MTHTLFDEVEAAADAVPGAITKTSWTGVLDIKVPGLESEYHLKCGKSKGNAEKVGVRRVDRTTGKEVESKEVVRLYRYTEDPTTHERTEQIEVPYDEAKAKIRFAGEGGPWLISARAEKRFFDREALATGKGWLEIPAANVADRQGEEEVSPFTRTTRIEVGPEDFVPLSRVPEYAMKEVYQLGANLDKKVREQSGRVLLLARKLMEKQVALLGPFVWKEGYSFYTAVIFPYEEPRSGKLWLLMATTEGIRQFDPLWALQDSKPEEKTVAAPMARKPTVRLSK
jgi:hypothetical protein